MHLWGVDGSEVSVANLNSTLTPFDAIVDGNLGATSGDAYATISAALAAGKRSIVIRPGDYTENVTIDNTCTQLIGLGTGISRTVTNLVVTIEGTLTVTSNAYGCRVSNMIIEPQGSGYGIGHSGPRDCVYDNIHCYGGSNNHFYLANYDRLLMRNCTSYNAGDHAFRFVDAVSASCDATNIIGCQARNSYGMGFSVGGETGTYVKDVNFIGCLARGCGEVYGYGFGIGGWNRGSLIGCRAYACDSHGFYFYDPDNSGVNLTVTGCASTHNGGYGFARPGTFSGAGHVFSACTAIGNFSGGWGNFGGVPVTCH